MHVAILHNLVSPDDSAADRDVLVQAEVVARALEGLGHTWETVPCTLDLAALHTRLEWDRPEVVFNLVESLGGADWLAPLVPALLDTLGISYTGSPTEALLLTNHKVLTKQWLCQAGLPTPRWIGPDRQQAGPSPAHVQEPPFQPNSPYMLKAVCEHASFGLDEECVVRAEDAASLRAAVARHACRIGRACFAERFVEGREFNLAILAADHGPKVLPPAEIDFSAFPPGKPRIVGRRAKWEEASFEFVNTPRHFDFPPQDEPLLDRLCRLAEDCWRLFGLAGYARVDFRVDGQGQPWILEINANPCLSPDAGFAAALARAGISVGQAVAGILQDAGNTDLGRQGSTRLGREQPTVTPRHGEPHGSQGWSFRDEVTPADRQLVRTIVESTGFFHPREVEIAVELVDERLQKGPASGYHFLFAEREGAVHGYACYGLIGCTQASYDLYWLVVEGSTRGQGLGRLLLAEAEERIRRLGGQRVYAETSNRPHYAPTRRFYERSGYLLEALLKDFYAPGDDKAIYVKVF